MGIKYNSRLKTIRVNQIHDAILSFSCRVVETSCPRCGSTEVNRKGTNATRKIGRVQQFVCKKCNHIYTHTSIERKKVQENYPKCPKCKSEASRWGFWKWNGSKVQRFHCKMCGHYFRIERKRRIKKEDIRFITISFYHKNNLGINRRLNLQTLNSRVTMMSGNSLFIFVVQHTQISTSP